MNKKLLFVLLGLAGINVFGNDLKEAVPCLHPDYQKLFQYRVHHISEQGGLPLFLFNQEKQIIGVADFSSFKIQGVFFCSSMQVDSFYYVSDPSPKLWVQAEANKIEITQDEGLLVLSAKKESDNGEAVVSKVSYLTYDVFHEDRKISAEQKASPLYLKDWGFPVGTGVFYVHFPKNLVR